MNTITKTLIASLLVALATQFAFAQNKPYRLPSVDLKQRVIWGSECIVDDNLGLQFGGQDQERGRAPPTSVRRDGMWVAVKPGRLRSNDFRRAAIGIEQISKWRRDYFEGMSEAEEAKQVQAIRQATANWPITSDPTSPSLWRRLNEERTPLPAAEELLPAHLAFLERWSSQLEQGYDIISSAPAGRALSPIVYDKQTKLFVLYGGDHLDYLTNDTWVFDPRKEAWSLRDPEAAPPPRANHKLNANGDGTVTLSGGYTYASNTDYMRQE